MTERQVLVHDVTVPAPFAGLRQVTRSFEVVDDLGRRSFRDSDSLSNVSEPDTGVGGHDLKHVGVIRYKPEKMVFRSGTRLHVCCYSSPISGIGGNL